MTRKITISAVGLLLALPLITSAQSADVRTQIQDLLTQISALKSTLTAAAAAGLPDDYGTDEPDGYCPTLTRTLQRGATDARTGGEVTELQRFLVSYYDLDETTSISGFFGKITQATVIRFQRETGLPALGIAGSLTRAMIAKKCADTGATSPLTSSPWPQPIPAPVPTPQSVISETTCTFTPNSTGRVDNIGFARGSAQTADICKQNCTASRNAKWGMNESGTCVYVGGNGTGRTVMAISAGSAGIAIKPAINSFLASPTSIKAGQPVTLTWTSSLATDCGILRDSYTWEAMHLGTSGSYTAYPGVSTTYTLSCAGTADGSGKDAPGDSRNVFVSVTQAVKPGINSFLASPTSVTAGQPVSLSWTSSLASQCGIIKDSNTIVAWNLATAGSYTVYPGNSTTYTLNCWGADDGTGKDAPADSRNVHVTVTAAAKPAINSFTASPTSVNAGGAVTLSWTSSLAAACGILKDSNTSVAWNLGTAASYTVNPTTSTTYTLSCWGVPDGSGKDGPADSSNLFVSVIQ